MAVVQQSSRNYTEERTKHKEVVFLVWKSSLNCGIKWQLPSNIEDPMKMAYLLKIYEDGHLYKDRELNSTDKEYLWDVLPGSNYDVEMSVFDEDGMEVAFGKTSMKAAFCMNEMYSLLDKALSFLKGSKSQEFSVLYRCKPECYWLNIVECSKNIMLPYLKDLNGQPATPINGVLKGLFFSAKLSKDGKLPSTSPFGEMRMIIDAEYLLSPDRVNFYFGDFYCNKFVHYTTIVVCLKGSESDFYCGRKLVRLPPENSFLKVIKKVDGTGYRYETNKKVYVEIYYTEPVNLAWGKFDRVQTIGIGTSRIGGLSNNKSCTECNLYPVPEPLEEKKPKSITERIRGVGSSMSKMINSSIHKVQKKITKKQPVNFPRRSK